jgi:formylglycine-generating enzyme required for sulfatase activity
MLAQGEALGTLQPIMLKPRKGDTKLSSLPRNTLMRRRAMNGKHRVWFVVCLAAVSIIGLAGGVLLGEKEVAPAPEAGGGKEVAPAKELTLDLGGEVTRKLVLVPAGKFMMGSSKDQQDAAKKEFEKAGFPDADISDEGPQREVTISKPFYLGVYEVTQAQYEQIMGKNPSNFKDAKNPVETVSWDEAVEFCKKLSEKTGKKVHLPTEAQWEYACRAGSKTMFSFGDDVADLYKVKKNSFKLLHPSRRNTDDRLVFITSGIKVVGANP